MNDKKLKHYERAFFVYFFVKSGAYRVAHFLTKKVVYYTTP